MQSDSITSTAFYRWHKLPRSKVRGIDPVSRWEGVKDLAVFLKPPGSHTHSAGSCRGDGPQWRCFPDAQGHQRASYATTTGSQGIPRLPVPALPAGGVSVFPALGRSLTQPGGWGRWGILAHSGQTAWCAEWPHSAVFPSYAQTRGPSEGRPVTHSSRGGKLQLLRWLNGDNDGSSLWGGLRGSCK